MLQEAGDLRVADKDDDLRMWGDEVDDLDEPELLDTLGINLEEEELCRRRRKSRVPDAAGDDGDLAADGLGQAPKHDGTLAGTLSCPLPIDFPVGRVSSLPPRHSREGLPIDFPVSRVSSLPRRHSREGVPELDDMAMTGTLSCPLPRRRADSGLLDRRANSRMLKLNSLTLVDPVRGYRDALGADGYSFGAMIGRSKRNRGFAVYLVEKEGRYFAAKGTNEGADDGVLAATLQREHRILRGLDHPGLVRAEALLEASHGCALVMQYCPGKNLDSLMPKGTALCDRGRHAVLEILLDAVSYLHERKVTHRDLHGQNIRVDCELASGGPAEAPSVKLVDFGSARDESDDKAAWLEDLSREILPPDASSGDTCPFACDVFALGLLAAGLCAGGPLETSDVVADGALGEPEELSAAGREHLRNMLNPLSEARPEVRECRASLPPWPEWAAAAAA